MLFSEYTETIDRFAIYPNAGEGKSLGLTYCTLGLLGETSETVNLTGNEGTNEDLFFELGDCAWYTARMLVELETMMEGLGLEPGEGETNPMIQPPSEGMIVTAGRIAEHVKKMLRGDDEGSKEAKENRINKLLTLLDHYYVYLRRRAEDNGFNFEEILQANVDKLDSRKERKVLKGDGDHR